MKLSKLKPNPNNPRIIKDKQFSRLVANIVRYPKFLEKRPIVHKDHVVQGGNMRLKSLEHILKMPADDFNRLIKDLNSDEDHPQVPESVVELWKGYRKTKSVPDTWIVSADDYTDDELKAFIVIDNVSFGDWDWDSLANDWEEDDLNDWGVDIPGKTKGGEPMLPVEEVRTVSFEVRKPGATSDDHSVFEQVMLHGNKQVLIETLNRIKDDNNLEKLEDALMHMVRYYNNAHN